MPLVCDCVHAYVIHTVFSKVEDCRVFFKIYFTLVFYRQVFAAFVDLGP